MWTPTTGPALVSTPGLTIYPPPGPGPRSSTVTNRPGAGNFKDHASATTGALGAWPDHWKPQAPSAGKREILSVLTCNPRNKLTKPMTLTTYTGTDGIQHAEKPVPTWPRTLPVQTALQESVHERHWDLRRKIILAIEAGYDHASQRRATRLAYCSNGASFFIDPALGKVRPWVSRCRDRMCLYCGTSRSRHVADQLLLVLNKMPTPRLIILTVKSVELPLADQLHDLRRWFAKLRRSPQWKNLTTGGAYTVEVTRNADTGLWHPHLNIIVNGTYFPQKLLRNLWHKETGSAEVVWVSAIRDRPGAARELAKYIGKPQHVSNWPDTAIRNYARAVNGTRMVQTFGDCYGLKVQDRDVEDLESPDTYQVKISRLVYLAHRGCPTPQKLLVLIADRWPQFRTYIYHQLPRLERPKTRGDQMRKLQRLIHGNGPQARAPPKTKSEGELQDTAIFIAFSRFRADDRHGVFTDLDYQS